MPCYSPDPTPHEIERGRHDDTKRRMKIIEGYLCEAIRSHPARETFFRGHPEIEEWFRNHEIEDQKREAAERAAKKLTREEYNALREAFRGSDKA